MSMRYKGAVISATPPTTSTTTATGVWTLPQQMQAQGAGNWPYGGPFTYIEDVFSTYLYTGTGTGVTQRIASGVDLSTYGGMVWTKTRAVVQDHQIFDTARGERKYIRSNTTDAEFDSGANSVQYKTSGWDAFAYVNDLNVSFASWTFRKQPKFFDVVTYTGNTLNCNLSLTNRNIAHSLGSQPGWIIVKRTDNTSDWFVQAINGAGTQYSANLKLNTTAASPFPIGISLFANTSTFNVGQISYQTGEKLNELGETYVAYLFASNAGGFGTSGNDNVITCGSYTGNGSATGPVVTLGYEPQWIMIKRTDSTGDWTMFDNMRGLTVGDNDAYLFANTSAAESTNATRVGPSATGFYLKTVAASLNASGGTYSYIAIRRGPMKVPTVGTSVFSPVARTGTGAVATVSVGFAPDFLTTFYRTDPGQDKVVFDRLRGPTQYLATNSTSQEINVSTNGLISFNNTSFTTNANGYANNSGSAFVNHVFGRAPGFFDEVCYTGNNANPQTLTHNLNTTPELIIVKQRNTASPWGVYSSSQSLNTAYLNRGDVGFGDNTNWGTAPTSTTFSVQGSSQNASGGTYVAYLFATCAGVSKVGSYSGTGATQTINCGFTGGARFVLIKRANGAGDWYVWDTARGMVSGTDPSLLLNDTAAEVNANSVYTTSVGFQIVSTAAGINASGGTYIFWAVA